MASVSAIKRKVIQAVAEQVHDHESYQQRERQRDRRNQRIRGTAEENENDQHHQTKSDVQRLLHILDAIHDR